MANFKQIYLYSANCIVKCKLVIFYTSTDSFFVSFQTYLYSRCIYTNIDSYKIHRRNNALFLRFTGR